MTTILLAFIIALVSSLFLTPVARMVGIRLGAVDEPVARKVHTVPLPRSGCIAFFTAFLLTLLIVKFFPTKVATLFVLDKHAIALALGGIIVF
ncbi:MAG: hypothetical protein PHY31_01945, partial [Smithellaceae bacterium]|nr:hypothetical protein [Smithellaceae bacterium]